MTNVNSAYSSTSNIFHIGVVPARFMTICPEGKFDGQTIILLRHGEAITEVQFQYEILENWGPAKKLVVFVFPDWIERSRLSETYYIPFDLNVPVHVPKRNEIRKAYALDPPLSEWGKLTSQMVARELQEKTPSLVIYSSPDLASLQTAFEIQHHLGDNCGKIKVEPLLATSHEARKHWLGWSNLTNLGYRIDLSHESISPLSTPHSFSETAQLLRPFLAHVAALEATVIVICPPVTMKILSDYGNGLWMEQYENDRDLSLLASAGFPPTASVVFEVSQQTGKPSIEPSEQALRPLTSLGGSNRVNPDAEPILIQRAYF